MKKILIVLAFLSIGNFACKKDCEAVQKPGCTDVVPDEACLAYFERWFFDPNTNSCKKVAYSGCSEYGFATEAECEECKCK
jgi:hypothetical protein